MKKNIQIMFIISIFILLSISFVSAGANWEITTFSCTPEEIAVGADFSCTTQVKNTGDTSGTLGTSTLYTDEGDWLEDSSYAVTANAQLAVGESTEITFSELKASKSGINGFSKVMHDLITDSAGVEDVTVNVINVLVSTSDSTSSLLNGQDSEVTADVVAGGNINVDLTFSGTTGCTIPNQDTTKTISNMNDGESTSRKWTVTVTPYDCTYTITATATGVGGIGSKIDSTSALIDCTDCAEENPDDSSDDSSGSSSGSSSSSSTASTSSSSKSSSSSTTAEEAAPELTGLVSLELGEGDNLRFSVAGAAHSLTIMEITESSATLEIRSDAFSTTINVGQEKHYDLDGDETADISIKLISTDVEKKTINLQIRPSGEDEEGEVETIDSAKKDKSTSKKSGWVWTIIIVLLGIVVIVAIILFFKKKKESGISFGGRSSFEKRTKEIRKKTRRKGTPKGLFTSKASKPRKRPTRIVRKKK